jgi:YD repeat-containing protein
VRLFARRDDLTSSLTAWRTLTDAPHSIEFEWRAASAPGVSDGEVSWWLDGVHQQTLPNLANDSHHLTHIRLGAVTGLEAGTSGSHNFDAYEARRAGYIGPGMVALKQSVSRSIAYSYDDLYRLTGATYSTGQNFAYTYDAVGNRTGMTGTPGTHSYTYDAAHRLTSVNGVPLHLGRQRQPAVGRRLDLQLRLR